MMMHNAFFAMTAWIMIASSWPLSAQETAPPWQPIITDFENLDRAKASDPLFEVPEAYELASVIVSLTPYGSERVYSETSGNPSPDPERMAYIDEVRRHFAPFADHPIVAAIPAKDATFWAWIYDFRENGYLFKFDDGRERPSALIHHQPFSHVWARPDNGFTRNIALIEDFARVSGFREFYKAHKPYYDKITMRDRASAPTDAMQIWLESNFSARSGAIRVVYSPLTGGWHSTQSFGDDDFVLNVMFIEPGDPTENERDVDFARILFTEIDHNYVNPASDNYKSRLDEEKLFGGSIWVDRSIVGNAYGSGLQVFNEYMTWAVFELWAKEHYGETNSAGAIERTRIMMEGDRGFIKYRLFSDKVAQLYIEGKSRSAGFRAEDIYPDLLTWAEELGRQQVN